MELVDRQHAGQHRGGRDIEHRADHERPDQPARQVPLRVLRLLAGRRDGVEADVGEESERGPLPDALEAARRERGPVSLALVEDRPRADADEGDDQTDLEHHHERVGARALLDPDVEKDREQDRDREGRQVDREHPVADAGRVLPGREHFARRLRVGQGRAGARQHPLRFVHDPGRVLDDEVPADDPGDELAERRVGVRVGAARHGNHGRDLGIAQRRETARQRGDRVREDHCRTRAVHHQRDAVGSVAADDHLLDAREQARADDRADPEQRQVERGERALQPGAAESFRVRRIGG